MAKATLQNAAGQKVVVESGSPEAQKYFGQGYTLMQAPAPASSSAAKPTASPAASVSSSAQPANGGYTSQDPAIQKQIADMQRQVQTLSSKASAYSAPSAPEAPKGLSSPAGQTQLQASGNSQVPAGLTKVEGVSRGPGGVSSTNAYTQNPNFDEEYENQQWIGNDLYASKIPLATLISPTGQRVVARTDSVTGTKYKPASEYFSQGYVLETSPGVYKDAATGKVSTFGAQQMEAAKPKQYEASKTQPVSTSLSGSASGGFSVPSGYTKISGALYPDRNSQLANFSDIQMYGKPGEPGSFLYGKPKNGSQPSDSSGSSGSSGDASAPAAAGQASKLPLDILSFLSQNVVSPEAATKAFGYGGNSQAEKAAALEKLYAESSKAIIDRQSQLKALEDEILKSMAVSPEEESAQKALDELSAQQRNISSSEELGINEIKKQPIAMSFLSGQTAAVQRDAASKINALASQSEPLKAQLIAAQAKRAAASDIAKTKYDIAQKQYQQFLDQTKPMEVGGNIVRFNPITQKFETVYEGPSDASKPVSVAPGSVLVDPATGKVMYSNPAKDSASTTNDIKEFEYARNQGYKGTFQDWLKIAANLKNASTGASFADESSLRKEFNSLEAVKQYNDLTRSFNGMNQAYKAALAKNNTGGNPADLSASKAAADQALITLYNKMLDPNSVVREGEYARSAEGQSTIAYAVGLYEKMLKGGGGITDQNRADMVDIAKRLMGDAKSTYDQNVQFYTGIAENAGIDPNRIIVPGLSSGTSSASGQTRPDPAAVPAYASRFGVSEDVVRAYINAGLSVEQLETALQGFSEQFPKAQAPAPQAAGAAGAGDVGKIMAAIRTIESNGNYSAKGGSGEYGAYQFMPGTWKSWAQKYLGDGNAAMSKENQDYVAERRISDLVAQGYGPYEIALIWNGGSPTVKKGTNKYGVAYDSGSYADKVLAQYNALNKQYAYAF